VDKEEWSIDGMILAVDILRNRRQDRYYRYNGTLRHFLATTFSMEKQ